MWGIEGAEDSKNILENQPVSYNCHIGAHRSQRSQMINNSVAIAVKEV